MISQEEILVPRIEPKEMLESMPSMSEMESLLEVFTSEVPTPLLNQDLLTKVLLNHPAGLQLQVQVPH
jgi:hypothetical protein